MEKGALGLLVLSKTMFPSSGVEPLMMWAVQQVGSHLPSLPPYCAGGQRKYLQFILGGAWKVPSLGLMREEGLKHGL